MYFKPAWVSAAILKAPVYRNHRLHKGAMILNQIDPLVQMYPTLKSLFILIERRGWHGMNDGRFADIKLVEDSSTLDDTRIQYPESISLDMGPADFIDTSAFQPLETTPEFDVIQISCWSKRKRIEMFIEAAARLPHLSFVHLGHFEDNGNAEELTYRDRCIALAQNLGANITFPFATATLNAAMPTTKGEINQWINRARVGVLTTASEGINRFKMECLSADRPVVVCDDVCVPTRKHINDRTGQLAAPTGEGIADAISHILDHRSTFDPRQYLLDTTGKARSVAILKDALAQHCRIHDLTYHFDTIEWDGRNESLAWGSEALEVLNFMTRKYADLVDDTEELATV